MHTLISDSSSYEVSKKLLITNPSLIISIKTSLRSALANTVMNASAVPASVWSVLF